MKILLFIILLASNAFAGPLIMGGGNKASSACDTSNIVFWWRAEALDFTATNGTLDYSAGNPSPAVNGSLVVSEAAAKYGTYGLDVDASLEYLYYATPSATLDDEFKFGAWVRITTWFNTFVIFGPYYSTNNFIRFMLTDDNELTLIWKDNSIERTALTTVDLSLGAGWHWIEVAAKTADNYRQIWVDGASVATTTASDISSFSSAVSTFYMGTYLNSGAADVHMDNVIISTDSTDDFTDCKDLLEWPE